MALAGLATLVRRYDEDDKDTYAANIMIYTTSSSVTVDRSEEVNHRLLHVGRDVGVENLRGFLDFRNDLSIVDEANPSTAQNQSGTDSGPDEEHPAVAFGIPLEEQGDLGGIARHKKWRIGPGAPHALIADKPGVFKDTDEIEAWMKENTLLGPETRAATMEYIRGDGAPDIGSFLSIPLPETSTSRPRPAFVDEDLPLGVINVHRSQAGILGGNDKRLDYFETTVLSINYMLSHLIEELMMLDEEKYGIWGHLSSKDPG
jgi:hypothetical protein